MLYIVWEPCNSIPFPIAWTPFPPSQKIWEPCNSIPPPSHKASAATQSACLRILQSPFQAGNSSAHQKNPVWVPCSFFFSKTSGSVAARVWVPCNSFASKTLLCLLQMAASFEHPAILFPSKSRGRRFLLRKRFENPVILLSSKTQANYLLLSRGFEFPVISFSSKPSGGVCLLYHAFEFPAISAVWEPCNFIFFQTLKTPWSKV